ncbi:hypothetical protein Zmor_005011 [Zophobas morio]|uniref:Uncharacterized protein n=1 Tax=Zophobas morio TaxID=2755281 RepID=A0AA38IX27_9CUCU|nr:hypothetical protein Zmor_005011 [Zophobas morio]
MKTSLCIQNSKLRSPRSVPLASRVCCLLISADELGQEKVFPLPIDSRKPCSDYTLLVRATFFLNTVGRNVIDYTLELEMVMREFP